MATLKPGTSPIPLNLVGLSSAALAGGNMVPGEGGIKMQAGIFTGTASGGNVSVTFPVPFAEKVIAVLGQQTGGLGYVTAATTSGFTWHRNDGGSVSTQVGYLALGV